MRSEHYSTDLADYTVYINEIDPRKPFTVFLHGGPGFNSYAERQILAPLLNQHLNTIWFDLLGTGETKLKSPELLTWDGQQKDIAKIIRHFGRGPVHLIGHCSGAQEIHDLVRTDRDLIRSVVYFSAAHRVSDVFKTVIRRSFQEERLSPSQLSLEELKQVNRFLELPEELFSQNEVMLFVSLLPKIKDFMAMYWTDMDAMRNYFSHMENYPFNVQTFISLQIEYFSRGVLPVPSYDGIPVLALYSDDDFIAPWAVHGKQIVDQIPHAQSRMVSGGGHWMQFQKPLDCVKHTVEFVRSVTKPNETAVYY